MDKRPLRVGLVFLSAALALAAMLLTGCGGGGADEGAKVEASLQHYLRTPYPQQSLGDMSPVVGVFIVGVFPIGAGPPQVKQEQLQEDSHRQGSPSAASGTLGLVVRHHVFPREDRTACGRRCEGQRRGLLGSGGVTARAYTNNRDRQPSTRNRLRRRPVAATA